jgi:predicted transcriptional regulator
MAKSVRDAMTDDPRSIGAAESVVEAARLMRDEHIGSLPVTENERLVGMITDRDITTRDDVSRGGLLSRSRQRRAQQRPRRGAPTNGPPPGSAAARCRER